MTLHELSHIFIAKVCRIKIRNIGFNWNPLPHVYVSVFDNGLSLIKRVFFMLSGNITTIILFVLFVLNVDILKAIYYAFAFQIIIEMNPFYSDYSLLFTFLKVSSKLKKVFTKNKKYPTIEDVNVIYKQENLNHLYSKEWYAHLFIWMIIIVLLLSPQFIISTI